MFRLVSAICLLAWAGIPAHGAWDGNPLVIEGEHLRMQGKSRLQGMRNFGPDWRGDAHLLWDGTVGQSMVTSFDIHKAGRYRLQVQLTLAPDYGIFSIHLNGKEVRTAIDTYSPRVELAPMHDLGEVRLKAGTQRLAFKLTGANKRAKKFRGRGYLMGLDFLRLIDLDPPKEPKPVNPPPKPVPTISADRFQSILAKHCHKCHGGEKTKGKVDLVALKHTDDFLERSELLEDMLTVLRDGDMPPEKAMPLADEPLAIVIKHIEGMLRKSLSTEPFAPTPIRRMNRFQYNNAVVDLLRLKRDIFAMPERLMRRRSDYFKPEARSMPAVVKVQNRPLGKDHDGERPEGFKGVAAFPQDRRAEHGFDNRADHLTLSPLLMESFLKLSSTIMDSKDLNPRECETWNGLFAPPKDATSVGGQVRIIRERMKIFLRRAFRRPVDPSTLDRFAAFSEGHLRSGASFPDTMKTLIGATIASPEFLYLYNVEGSGKESEAPQTRQKIDDFELASRLSFFLWASIPDDTLLDLAQAGKLSDPKTLGTEIDRMLDDRRMSRFCDSFPSQWLQLDRLVSAIPDPKRHPYFYFNGYRASMHMMMEPLLLFETVYVEDRSIVELIDPRYTWQSDLLRHAYEGRLGRRETQTITFRRVPVQDPRRGGVITNAAVMTMTSNPERSLPITRGAWVNTVIFNDPPPPPPADVPPLPEADEEKLSKLTIRERFVEHRKREDCASCHKQIDPLGFALENYGPTGVWRDKYENGREVDTSGSLFNRYEFKS
ncbi:MAG: DUF1588 domain-containing protein, partial [Phycisphaerae bacterium]|nr:DUF1588 domain-containing protein [Phycisphaerae bacterium]